MQQRRLRLGDILDDYCPRERRITNHAVVAMIEDHVKQTRCTTCDADHEYKQAKMPALRRRKTAAPEAHLVEGAGRVPADVQDAHEEDSVGDDLPITAEDVELEESVEVAAAPTTVQEEPEPADSEEGESDDEREWPVHRPLIRATLPRPEGQTPERKPTDFTSRPAGGKFDSHGNAQRFRGQRPGHQAQGNSSSGHNSRFGGQRPAGPGQRGQGQGGQGQGGPQGQRGNRPGQGGSARPGQGRGPRPGGGRKRGR